VPGVFVEIHLHQHIAGIRHTIRNHLLAARVSPLRSLEMKQVTWPSREDVIATTWVVIATVAFYGVFHRGGDKAVQMACVRSTFWLSRGTGMST